MRWIKPWMVAATLTLVAAAGATTVFFVANAQHDRDKRDIEAWLKNRYPAARDAVTTTKAQQRLLDHPATDVQRVISSSLTSLTRSADRLVVSPLPEILRPVTEKYLEAIEASRSAFREARAAAADGTIDDAERVAYSKLWAHAVAAFKAAADVQVDLICRARLLDCVS